jgi:impB/mucB/samB family/IMS family HHH motif
MVQPPGIFKAIKITQLRQYQNQEAIAPVAPIQNQHLLTIAHPLPLGLLQNFIRIHPIHSGIELFATIVMILACLVSWCWSFIVLELPYTDLVEPLSLDEAYLDVTQNKPRIPSATAIAREIKQAIKQEADLTASAEVSINKFLVKIASGLDKSDGLYLIAPETAATFVANLPIEKFYGVGTATAQKMQNLGIQTGADLKHGILIPSRLSNYN